MLAKASCESEPARKVGMFVNDIESGGRSAMKPDQQDTNLSRDAFLCDGDDSDNNNDQTDNDRRGTLRWAPYIHFGV
jgi:hypothetical protein